MVGLLAWFWLRDAPSVQHHRMIPTFPTLFFGTLFLWLWAVLFSRLPGRLRLGLFLSVGLVAGLVCLLLEIKEVDGNLKPIVGWRWSGERTFDDSTVAAGDTAAGPDDYPQFYGPNRDATLAGPRLARDWQARPPRELWRQPVGEGCSSYAVVGEAAVTQEQRGDDEAVVRYELRTGRQVWIHGEHAPFNTTVGGRGPRATPTIAGGRVYNLGATGLLRCLDLADGRLRWKRDVLDDHDVEAPDWGLASSPLVAGELVVVGLGRRGISLAAYDRQTGEPAWKAGAEAGSYSTPTLAMVAGREQILMLNQTSVAGHHPVTGERLWREPWVDPGERVSPPLVLTDQEILVSAGYGIGSRRLRIADRDGALAVEERWESRRLKSKFAPMVLRDGVVYGLDDGILVALDPETGERLWKRGRYGHGQLILVDDLLLIQAENGDVVLVEASPEEHRELARLEALDGKTWNPPALSGRLLLIRNSREAACYELPVAPEESPDGFSPALKYSASRSAPFAASAVSSCTDSDSSSAAVSPAASEAGAPASK